MLTNNIPKRTKMIISERVLLTNKPYIFKISGVTGFGNSLRSSAHGSYELIKKWAERKGAEVNLLQDKYKEIFDGNYSQIEHMPLELRLYREKQIRSKNQSKGYLLIEITDPAARLIEEIIDINDELVM